MNRRLAGCFAIVLCVAASMGTASGAAKKRPIERVSPAPEVNPSAVVWRTPKPPAEPQAGDVWVNPKAGMEMVWVAPGKFVLGTSTAQVNAWLKEHPNHKREWFKNEQPQCLVNLPGYWIGRTPVTNAQYQRFVQATGRSAPWGWRDGQVPRGRENYPVVYVSWSDARAYCAWAGLHLPTELQWERAARGRDGRVFPWGDQWDSSRCCNNAKSPAAVDSHPTGASPYGCLDMAGNVWQWCTDWYDGNAYQRYAQGNLSLPEHGTDRVLRGGSWDNVPPWNFRCAHRAYRYNSTGFRCARGAQ